jgi:hypothetical protein
VLIDGAYEAWPRDQKFPSPGKVIIQYGKPVSQREARKYSPQDFVNRVRRELIEIQQEVRSRAGRTELDYPEMRNGAEPGEPDPE